MSNKSFPVGSYVINDSGYTGIILDEEIWVRSKVLEDDLMSFENPKQLLDHIKNNQNCFCVELDSSTLELYTESHKYWWGSAGCWRVIKDSSADMSCNHEYILMLNNRCCKYCGEYE